MREKGDVLEQFVFDSWPKSSKEWIRYEANSGAKYGENDLITPRFSIECKRKLSSESINLSREEVNKCINRSLKRGKCPLWVSETIGNRKFATLEYSDFINIIKTNTILLEELEIEVEHGKTKKDS
jgi:hypothetical protein